MIIAKWVGMTEAGEIKSLADFPIGELAKHCQDPTMLATVVSLAFNQGYKLGQEQTHRYYSTMMARQCKLTQEVKA